jgi:ribonuclease/clavin/mitogillin
MHIYNVGNSSISLYLLDSGTHRLLVDTGFPGDLNTLGREMRKTGFRIRDIDHVLVTHFHVDHAGAVQELKNEGVKFVLFDIQKAFISPMEKMTTGKWKYVGLSQDDNLVIDTASSREFLRTLTINGEVIPTPGHSDDSISLLLDTGEAFIGDLSAESLMGEENVKGKGAWALLRKLGAKEIYPAHANSYTL